MMSLESRHCPLCGPAEEKVVRYPATFNEADLNSLTFSARRQPDRLHFQMVECTGCGIVFSDPSCDPLTLAQLYQESKVHYQGQEAQILDSYTPVLDRALLRLSRRGMFVEVGGGSGFMLRYGAEKGFDQLVEVEPSGDAEQRFAPPTPRARFIRNVLVPGILSPSSASLICFFQMLDHVPQPGAFMKTVFEVLEPGGVAVGVTHNTRALSARVLGERSPIFDIQHTFLFNSNNLSRLFEQVGLSRVEAFPMSNRYSLRYWLQLAPLPHAVKTTLGKILESTHLSDIRIPLRAGNIAVLGQKEQA